LQRGRIDASQYDAVSSLCWIKWGHR
jgi:hypothetical protein